MLADFVNSILQGIGEHGSLYFYSSIFQGNAALVTLTAMFIIYKKQGFDYSINRIERIIIDYLTNACKISINYGSIFELEIYREEMCRGFDDKLKDQLKEMTSSIQWKNRFDELRELKKEFNIFIKDASRSMINTFTLMILSIALLPFSEVIHQNRYVEIGLFIIMIILQIVSLMILFNFLRRRLRQVA